MRKMMMTMSILLVAAGWAGAGEVSTVDGVIHVANDDTPRDGVSDMTLTELWRRGGEDDDVFFGVVLKALSDEAGNVYVLDMQLSQVFVFGPDGEQVGTLSREGDGPGEVRQPSDMLWMPDGSLGLVQTFPGRIVQVTTDDQPAGVYKTGVEGAIIAVPEAKAKGGNMVMGVIDIQPVQGGQDRHMYLGGFDAEGNELCRYTGMDVHWDFANLVFREREQYFIMFGKWDLMADGRVIAMPDVYDYAYTVYAADGTPERVVSRAFEPYTRDDEDRGLMETMMSGAASQFPFPVATEIEDVETAIGQIIAHPSGEVWVLPPRGVRNQPEGVLATYDVFDAEGQFVRREQVHCEGNGRRDGLIFIGDDRLLVVRGLTDAMGAQFGGGTGEGGQEAEPIQIICYRID